MARKFNKFNNKVNNNICKDVTDDRDNGKLGRLPRWADKSTTTQETQQQRVDVNADLGFGFDIDLSGSIWGRAELDSKTVTGHPVTGVGSGNGHLNFKIHLDGEAEGEGEVKGMLAKVFLKILS